MQPQFLPLCLWAIIILRAGPWRVWLKVANVGLLDKFGLGFIVLLDSILSLSLSAWDLTNFRMDKVHGTTGSSEKGGTAQYAFLSKIYTREIPIDLHE